MPPAQTSVWLTRIPDARRYPPLAADLTTDVCVVGGGIAGVAAAYFLAKGGKRVALLEANHLGTGETGFTTAFLTSSVDPPLSGLREQFGDDHIRRVRQAGEDTIALVETVTRDEDIDCGFHRLDAFAIGPSPGTRAHLEQEEEALRVAGGSPEMLDAEALRARTGLHAVAAVRIPGQGAFDVRAFLFGLAEHLKGAGGEIFEETRMTALEPAAGAVMVKTPAGTVQARSVVLATGLFPRPFQAANTSFRQMVTYVIALTLADRERGGALPDALFWDVGEPFHYMRFVHPEPGRGVNGAFLIGGEDRPLKEATKAGEQPWQALEAFARTFLPGGFPEVTHRWRGQILETADALPIVGVPPGGDSRILLVSGFGGNGMTFGTLGGKTAATLITGTLKPADNPFGFERQTLSPTASP